MSSLINHGKIKTRTLPPRILQRTLTSSTRYFAHFSISLLFLPIFATYHQVSYWVCTAILCEKTTPRQSHLLRKFIKVAYKCLLWNNFNGIMQILSGLGNTSISRLKDPWNNLPSHTKAKFQKLELLMAPQQNYKCYRERFRETPYPKLPYLAVILRDITFVNVGNAKYRAGTMPCTDSFSPSFLFYSSKHRWYAQLG